VAISELEDERSLTSLIEHEIGSRALEVDRTGTFPRAQLDALAAVGVLGMASSPDVGGGGKSLREVADLIREVARQCGSTAMVLMMHFSAVAALEQAGNDEIRGAVARGEHLATLAFSEVGSRSHFWAPVSTASPDEGGVRLDAEKSWVTSAGEADSYVWSSRPLAADGPMTLWSVPASTSGVEVAGSFDGLGLRGNGSRPMRAVGAVVDAGAQLGSDGGGLDLAMAAVLPWFLVLNAAASVGLMEAVTDETARHLMATRLTHLDQALAQQAIPRSAFARMRIETDRSVAFLRDTIDALEAGRDDAMLRVLEVKAVCSEAAITVTDHAMTVCGGAAFRKELGIERRFRDARAARVMAPTTDALFDLVGRATLTLPLLGD
jgi:alkylation response protein AidB-like acyl-CoA dehydrogenase